MFAVAEYRSSIMTWAMTDKTRAMQAHIDDAQVARSKRSAATADKLL
jgi:hypothetical protein